MLNCSGFWIRDFSFRTVCQKCFWLLDINDESYVHIVMPISASVSSDTAKSTKQYVCNVCGKPFDSAETLSSHQRFEHSEPGHPKRPAGVG
jgi:C2H2 type zinc finger protein